VSYVDGKKIKKEKVNGMRKKTISDGTLRLVCYYQKEYNILLFIIFIFEFVLFVLIILFCLFWIF